MRAVLSRMGIGIGKILLEKTNISANQVTIWRNIILFPPVFYCFQKGEYYYSAIAIVFFAVNMILDFTDGFLARERKTLSWLDASGDGIMHALLLISMTIGAFRQTGNESILIWGLVIQFGQAWAALIATKYLYDFDLHPNRGLKKFIKIYKDSGPKSIADELLKNILMPGDTQISKIILFRPYFIIGILLNRFDILVYGYCIAINIRWFVMYIVYNFYFSKVTTRFETVNILTKLAKDVQENRK